MVRPQGGTAPSYKYCPGLKDEGRRIISCMSTSDRRHEAWQLRYVSLLNSIYWPKIICSRKRKQRIYVVLIVVLGALITITVQLFGSWILAAASGGMTVLLSILRFCVETADTKDAKRSYERWSELCSDADRLWDKGERNGWRKNDLEQRIAELSERERQYQSSEYEGQQNELVRECQRQVNEILLGASGDGKDKKEGVRQESLRTV